MPTKVDPKLIQLIRQNARDSVEIGKDVPEENLKLAGEAPRVILKPRNVEAEIGEVREKREEEKEHQRFLEEMKKKQQEEQAAAKEEATPPLSKGKRPRGLAPWVVRPGTKEVVKGGM